MLRRKRLQGDKQGLALGLAEGAGGASVGGCAKVVVVVDEELPHTRVLGGEHAFDERVSVASLHQLVDDALQQANII